MSIYRERERHCEFMFHACNMLTNGTKCVFLINFRDTRGDFFFYENLKKLLLQHNHSSEEIVYKTFKKKLCTYLYLDFES